MSLSHQLLPAEVAWADASSVSPLLAAALLVASLKDGAMQGLSVPLPQQVLALGGSCRDTPH